jgi:hypothetical protein
MICIFQLLLYLFLVGAPSVDPDPESCLEAIGLLGALLRKELTNVMIVYIRVSVVLS